MPRNLLDYAQPHPRHIAVPTDRTPWRESRKFRLLSLILALSLIAAPLGALTIPLCDHSYGLVGAAVFVITATAMLVSCPSKWRRSRLLFVAFLLAIVTTTTLHIASTNTFVLENASGQPIAYLEFSLAGNQPRILHYENVPSSAVVDIRVHDLSYNGSGNFAGGRLADGTRLYAGEFKAATYGHTVKLRVSPTGVLDITWP